MMVQPNPNPKRRALRQLAIVCFVFGAIFCAIGAFDVFGSYANLLDSLDSVGADATGMVPKYAWCIYVGVPLLGISLAFRVYLNNTR